MVRVYLELKDSKWKVVEQSSFWITDRLLKMLDNIKRIQNNEWDGVLLIDGKERSGKSILGMLCAWYLSNGKLTEDNFALGMQDAARKIAALPDKSVLIVDEGSTMFGSKDSQTSEQKTLMKILDVVGQKNMIFIVCLPCFFDLVKTIAVRRSLFLLHVYPDENYNRGKFAFFGEKTKGKLYKFGKKNFDSYSYPEAEFVAEYMNFKPYFYEKYLEEVKRETLKNVLKAAKPKETNQVKYIAKMKDILTRIRTKFPNLTQEEYGELMGYTRTGVQKLIHEIDNDTNIVKSLGLLPLVPT